MLPHVQTVWGYRWSDLQPYELTHIRMEQYALHVAQGIGQENVWFLSHPPVYTQGRGVSEGLDGNTVQGIPVFQASRGGDITYHGPEQRMVYPIIALQRRALSISVYLDMLEEWIIRCLQHWGVSALQDPKRRGVWVGTKKICALGIAVKRGIALHGLSLNVYAASKAFSAITPCGITGSFGVTSLEELGVNVSLEEVDHILWTYRPFSCGMRSGFIDS